MAPRALLLLVALVVGCDDTDPPAADAALPACADLCTSALCNAAGECACVVDGAPVACRGDR